MCDITIYTIGVVEVNADTSPEVSLYGEAHSAVTAPRWVFNTTKPNNMMAIIARQLCASSRVATYRCEGEAAHVESCWLLALTQVCCGVATP